MANETVGYGDQLKGGHVAMVGQSQILKKNKKIPQSVKFLAKSFFFFFNGLLTNQ